ncbi:MAG: class I SAM-dependent methyltransferase [Candidatus Omnitrophica bacterium]|nr:class I SAM-dependent methyltransferase [Candidatus Omnitrophota bacterium]
MSFLKNKIFKSIKEIFYPKYHCPICGFYGVFLIYSPPTGKRKHAQCPKCKALERHRLQYCVVKKILQDRGASQMSMLHFAPEQCLHSIFKTIFKPYLTADLSRDDVDKKEDVTNLSFADESFDLVFASCVMPYIKEDNLAFAQIKRVLKPQGIAILTVPVIGEKTIEYPEPNPSEDGHIRCPGYDYFQRYKSFFSKIIIYTSKDFSKKYQLYVNQNRMDFSRKDMPLRPAVAGKKYLEFVPVCYK